MLSVPILISAFCVTLYWGTVIVKLVRLSRKIGKVPNAIPREKLGKKLRLIWGPTVLIWIIQLWAGLFNSESSTPVSGLIHSIGAIIALVTTGLTFFCWHKMGTSWRIGIDPNEKTQLIVTGPYKFVRHPIYTLSIFLAIGTFLTLPTFLMLLTILVHISLLMFEAVREERYLQKQHGEYYINYIKSVGRFIPRSCPFSNKSGTAE